MLSDKQEAIARVVANSKRTSNLKCEQCYAIWIQCHISRVIEINETDCTFQTLHAIHLKTFLILSVK